MNNDYGKVLGQALRAVRKMHEETAELLRDCDRLMARRGYETIFADATDERMSKRLDEPMWVISRLSRAYRKRHESNGRALFITVAFYEEDNVPEPILIVAEIDYGPVKDSELKGLASIWDAWNNTADWAVVFASLGSPGACDRGFTGNVEGIRYLARPLVSITRLEDVQEMISIVETYEPPEEK